MRLKIEDGYTIRDTTPAIIDGREYPVVSFTYRPALPEAVFDLRYRDMVAQSGKAKLDARTEFLAKHLVSWDVTDGKDQPVPPTAENLARIPDEILGELMTRATRWAPKSEDDLKNSSTG